METTLDAFLGGRLTIEQPNARHHRAGLDAVFLAAAADPPPDALVADLGAGVGTAGLCLAARRPDVRLQLVERDPDLAALARANLMRNGPDGGHEVVEADILAGATALADAGLAANAADMAIVNPPFYKRSETRASPKAPRAAAHVLEGGGLDAWIRCAAHLVKARGQLVLIFPAAGLAECLGALGRRFGGGAILPLHPRPGRPASKIVLVAHKGRRAAPELLPGLVLHPETGNAFSPAAEAILRCGQALPMA